MPTHSIPSMQVCSFDSCFLTCTGIHVFMSIFLTPFLPFFPFFPFFPFPLSFSIACKHKMHIYMYMYLMYIIGLGSMGAVGALAPKLLKAWGHCPRRIIFLAKSTADKLTLQDNVNSAVIALCGFSTGRAYVIQWWRLPFGSAYSLSTSYAYVYGCCITKKHCLNESVTPD